MTEISSTVAKSTNEKPKDSLSLQPLPMKHDLAGDDQVKNRGVLQTAKGLENGNSDASEDGDIVGSYTTDEPMGIDPAADRRVCRKIDWHIIPWMFTLYFVQQFDKLSLSYAAIMGIREDLNLTPAQYSWTGSILYLGYLAFVYLHNRMMQKYPLSRYIACTVVGWGIILTCHAACTNFAGLMVVRFFLGAFEGSITAGFVLMTARWYRSDEQATRTAFWFCANGFVPILGGAFTYAVAEGFYRNNSITFAPWKVVFIISGIITVFFGAAMLYFVPDSPLDAKWLNEEDRHIAMERLRANQQSIGNKVFKWNQFREAFLDIRSWLYCLFCITCMIPSGGITVFFTLLIQGYGFNPRSTLLITMPAGVVQIVVNIGVSWLAQKYRNRMLWATIGMLFSIFSISLMTGLARDGPTAHRIGQLVGYYILYGNSATAFILILSLISTNVAGYTKKTTVNAMTLSAYCVGFLIGPQTFRDGPYYTNAKYNIIAQYMVALSCCVALLLINKRENKKRDNAAATLATEEDTQQPGREFVDLTDKENPKFRYAL
ncbi:uncharacterized protein HMPREF1541_02928 [Cyphellophora europaea CBS 101466]|uniref:Major facilitator superfamily (MFS) profile domain-containing protein n=1 Tax=Cyphellophora europaea (strain CBS 101466) TaxID=1220924 RepID=W2RWX3_CYPE1|nr:uncharacterized protein HMPREF1541_02928 [Cyphellophora europaea CBS 101466]ETN40996.1 hypothetical protein HMPREF1541_02928 [Cyphellophora europaea CBS 101466]